MFQHALALVDLSPNSGHALQAAACVARACGARLSALFVRQGLPRDEASAELDFFVQTWAGEAEVAAVVVDGRPPYASLDWARSHDVDLLVCGSHGKSGLAQVALGSFAERLLCLADIPIWVSRARPDSLPPRKLVLATDLTPTSARASEVALGLASSFGVPLVALHAVHIPPVGVPPSTWDDAEADARERLSCAFPDPQPAARMVRGRPDRTLPNEVEALAADLIICGTRHITALERLTLGSVAGALVRTARRSVLVVPSK